MAKFICMWLFQSCYHLANQVETPNNFSINHRRAQIDANVIFVLRQIDISSISLSDIAMLDGTVFLNWVNRGQEKDILKRRLEYKGAETVTDQILTIKKFEWKNTGGRCFRGEVSILWTCYYVSAYGSASICSSVSYNLLVSKSIAVDFHFYFSLSPTFLLLAISKRLEN